MASLILDEWVWHDLEGENGKPHQIETYTFLRALQSGSDHSLLLVAGSAFEAKSLRFSTHTDVLRREMSRLWRLGIRFNSNKLRILKDLSPLPEDLASLVKLDDHYIVQAALAEPEALVVTTDLDLSAVLQGKSMQCILRDSFLRNRDETTGGRRASDRR